MATTIVTKNSATAGSAPSAGALSQGELAVNVADKRLFTKDSGGSVVEVGTNPGGAVTFTAGSASAPAITTTGDTNTGIFFPAADTIAFSEGGAEAARFDSSGNFYVGTTSQLGGSNITFNQPANADMKIGASVSTATRAAYQVFVNNTVTTLGTENSSGGSLVSGSSAYSTVISNSGAYPISFGTNNAERMRLDSSGNLGLGVTPSDWVGFLTAFDLNGNGSISGGATLSTAGLFIGSNNYYNSGWKYKISGQRASYYSQADGVHAWNTAASGTAGNAITFTQAMTLDANSNLAVGGTTVSNYMDGVTIGKGSSLIACNIYMGSGTGGLNFMTATAGGGRYDGFVQYNGGSQYLTFGTASTERMRIDGSGNLQIGTTSNADNYKVNIRQSGAAVNGVNISSTATSGDGSVLLTLGRSYAVNNTIPFLVCADTSAARVELKNNGGIYNYQANNVNLSDRREKTNFAPAGNYLEKICSIPVQTFNYIDQNREDDDGLTLGVVAQDVQAVAPELVTESDWGTKEEPKMRLSIYQTDLQYALMKAIQELKAEVDSLKAQLENK